MRLKTIKRSHRADKKWDAVFIKKDGKEIVTPFGQKGYSDYTKHKNKTLNNNTLDLIYYSYF